MLSGWFTSICLATQVDLPRVKSLAQGMSVPVLCELSSFYVCDRVVKKRMREEDEQEGKRFVEIMAPVFSKEAWRCVWHMLQVYSLPKCFLNHGFVSHFGDCSTVFLQNDLVHGWGIDFALRKCVEPAHDKIRVVNSQWVIHQALPSLGNQGEAQDEG
ncbi:hypothetical protein MLD38_002383 [Melastoma candidum]|uniref:Uncharacterized protein n=1 Tax=Melastoma candidum TaxID=119954 RepID=A0ACB9S3J2_9MYRT|nr:hypothetical protein MLD38_002383 [Melastoma candidum]